MSIVLLFLVLLCGSALSTEPNDDSKQRKRGIIGGNDGWVGIPNPYSYGHGHPWSGDLNPWKGLKPLGLDLGHGGYYGGFSYGRGPAISLPYGRPDILKSLPVYITKHIVVEKPVPVPQPVFIEKPYHIPVEKVVHVPIEKIIHRTVPVPVPVPQAIPIPVEHPIAIPVKHPVAVPVHQPYPVPVKQAVPIPVPVPFPIPVHPPFPPIYGSVGLPGAFIGRGIGPGSLYPGIHGHSLPPHFGHGFGHGFGHELAHGFGHGYHGHGLGHGFHGHGFHGHSLGHSLGHSYSYPHYTPYHYAHSHDHFSGHGHGHKRDAADKPSKQ